jgi:hypothetical protein
MKVVTRKILLSGLLGIVSATSATIAATGYAASEPAWVHAMSKPTLHELLAKAIEDNDYNAFLDAFKGKPGAQLAKKTITNDQFAALVATHKLRTSQLNIKIA